MINKPIIGLEVECPDGVGRVQDFKIEDHGGGWIQVKTYIKDRGCKWGLHNVKPHVRENYK